MPSTYRDNFISSFPMWTPFISFSCLITLARISRTMLNRSDGSQHTCFVPDPKGKAFKLSFLSVMLTVDLSYMTLITLRYVTFISNLLSLKKN